MVRVFNDVTDAQVLRLANRNISVLKNCKALYVRDKILFVLNLGAYQDTIEEFADKFSSLNDSLAKCGTTILAVRGSDDNKALFKDENWDALSNIKLAEDYTIVRLPKIKDGDVLVVGGDLTLNKRWRIKHGRYFGDEKPVFDASLIQSEEELGFKIRRVIFGSDISGIPYPDLIRNDCDKEGTDERVDLVCDAYKMMMHMTLKGHSVHSVYLPGMETYTQNWNNHFRKKINVNEAVSLSSITIGSDLCAEYCAG